MDDAGSDTSVGVPDVSNVAVTAVHNESALTATVTAFETRRGAVET